MLIDSAKLPVNSKAAIIMARPAKRRKLEGHESAIESPNTAKNPLGHPSQSPATKDHSIGDATGWETKPSTKKPPLSHKPKSPFAARLLETAKNYCFGQKVGANGGSVRHDEGKDLDERQRGRESHLEGGYTVEFKTSQINGVENGAHHHADKLEVEPSDAFPPTVTTLSRPSQHGNRPEDISNRDKPGRSSPGEVPTDNPGTDIRSTPRKRKKYRGWAWVDEVGDQPLNSQDQFQKVVEDAANAAISNVEGDEGKQNGSSVRSLRKTRQAPSNAHGQEAEPSKEKGSATSSKKSSSKKEQRRDLNISTASGESAPSIARDAERAYRKASAPRTQTSKKSRQKNEEQQQRDSSTEQIDDPFLKGTTSSVHETQRPPDRHTTTTLEKQARRLGKAELAEPSAEASQSVPEVVTASLSSWARHAARLVAAVKAEPSTFDSLRFHVLGNLTGSNQLGVLPHSIEPFQKIQQLLNQTVLAGEGNSMLVIGSRGTGKTALVETAISELARSHKDDFHVVRLNGFIHTDDKLALREIWRQLGRELEGEDEDKGASSSGSYADTLTSLLALLSHHDQSQEAETSSGGQTSRSIIFVLEEFELFASHPRQTLLYNLFDAAQSHRHAPIAVLGLTTKVNVVDNLEKRVKSRFGQRYVHLSLPSSLQIFQDICLEALTCRGPPQRPSGSQLALAVTAAKESPAASLTWSAWHDYATALLALPHSQLHLKRTHHTTNRPIDFMTAYLLPWVSALDASTLAHPPSSSLSLSSLTAAPPAAQQQHQLLPLFPLAPPESSLHHLSSLTTLQLALLVAATRLDVILDTDLVSFDAVYDEYVALASRAKVAHQQSAFAAAIGSSSAGGAVSATARVWSRDVALTQWEGLVRASLVIPASTSSSSLVGAGGLGVGAGGSGAGDAGLWRVDVGVEELGAWLEGEGRGRSGNGSGSGGLAPGTATALGKWCREI